MEEVFLLYMLRNLLRLQVVVAVVLVQPRHRHLHLRDSIIHQETRELKREPSGCRFILQRNLDLIRADASQRNPLD